MKRFSEDTAAQDAVRALPFVESVSGYKVVFKPITMASYTCRGVYVHMRWGNLSQEALAYTDAPHPHACDYKDDLTDDHELCAPSSDTYNLIREGRFIQAVYNAFGVACTHTYWDAPQYIPQAVACDWCGKPGGSSSELKVNWFCHRGNYYVVHRKECYAKKYEECYGRSPRLNDDDDDDDY